MGFGDWGFGPISNTRLDYNSFNFKNNNFYYILKKKIKIINLLLL